MKQQAEWLQAIVLSLMSIAIGIEIGHWTQSVMVSIVITWAAALVSIFSLSAQIKYGHEAITEKVDAFRYRGLYPPKGQGNDEDVKRLKEIGEKGLALRLYLELHAMPLKEAHRAFRAL